MKQAGNAEFIVWAIVAIIVMVAKGLGKLATPADADEPKPVSRPRTPPHSQPRSAVTSRRMTPGVVPPVVRTKSAAVAPPVIPAAPVVPVEKPTPPTSVPQALPDRASQWVVALRDRKNLRNVMIANEIIGRPVSLRERS